MSDQYGEWQDRAIEAFAAAWYRASGFSKGLLNPRWEFVDPVIQKAWRAAADRYVVSGELREPVLEMVGSTWHEVMQEFMSKAVAVRSGERLAAIIQEADDENPEWAKGARFVLGWERGPNDSALEAAFRAVVASR